MKTEHRDYLESEPARPGSPTASKTVGISSGGSLNTPVPGATRTAVTQTTRRQIDFEQFDVCVRGVASGDNASVRADIHRMHVGRFEVHHSALTGDNEIAGTLRICVGRKSAAAVSEGQDRYD